MVVMLVQQAQNITTTVLAYYPHLESFETNTTMNSQLLDEWKEQSETPIQNQQMSKSESISNSGTNCVK